MNTKFKTSGKFVSGRLKLKVEDEGGCYSALFTQHCKRREGNYDVNVAFECACLFETLLLLL